MKRLHASVRGLLALIGALAVVFLAVAPASAHLTIDTVTPQGDGTVTLVFAFDHACTEGAEPSGTTGLRIDMPDQTAVISVSQQDGWTHVVDRRRIEFSGPPIADGERAEFLATVRVGGKVGRLIAFPAVQTCADGSSVAWADDSADSENPAPAVVATSAIVDPAMSVVTPPAVPQGAAGWQVAVAVALFTAAAIVGAVVFARRTGRRGP